jgi:hypothetical protein
VSCPKWHSNLSRDSSRQQSSTDILPVCLGWGVYFAGILTVNQRRSIASRHRNRQCLGTNLRLGVVLRPLEACRTASIKRRCFCRRRSRDSRDRFALPCVHEGENELYASLGRSRLVSHPLDGAHLAGYWSHPEKRTPAAEDSDVELGVKPLDPLLRSFRFQLYHPGYLLASNGPTNRF